MKRRRKRAQIPDFPFLNMAIEQANLFVIALDDERHWYRYHHLFAEVLKNRLQQTHPQLLPQLHLRASTWYEQHGFVAEATQHALAAPGVEQAARLIEHHGITLISRSQYHSLLDWITALLEALVRTHPLLALIQVAVLTFTWHFEEARTRLETVEGSVQATTQKVTLTRFCRVREEKSGNLYRGGNHDQITTKF
jgi:LuxR family maltose regulon positive regulatory protein